MTSPTRLRHRPVAPPHHRLRRHHRLLHHRFHHRRLPPCPWRLTPLLPQLARNLLRWRALLPRLTV